MLTLYLACLFSGAILLVISMFSGGDADGDIDHGLDAHADISHSLEAHGGIESATDSGGALDHGVDSHVPAATDHAVESHAGEGGALAAAFQFFSFRNVVYLTTFFGLTGSVLTWLGTAAAITLLTSVGMGAFAMMVGHKFMRYLKSSETGQGLHEREFIGRVVTTALSPSKQRKGKVRLSLGAHIIELPALVHPDSSREEFRFGEHALILEIEKNIALIDEADFAEDAQ